MLTESTNLTFPHLHYSRTSLLQDLVCVGSSHGTIYIIDLNLSAISISAAHAIIAPLHSNSNPGTGIVDSYHKDLERKKENYSILSGQTDMCVCVYVCRHACIVCMYVCMYFNLRLTCMCIYACVCTDVCIQNACMDTESMYVYRMYVCIYTKCVNVNIQNVYMYVCMYLSMYVCMYEYRMNIFMYLYLLHLSKCMLTCSG